MLILCLYYLIGLIGCMFIVGCILMLNVGLVFGFVLSFSFDLCPLMLAAWRCLHTMGWSLYLVLKGLGKVLDGFHGVWLVFWPPLCNFYSRREWPGVNYQVCSRLVFYLSCLGVNGRH